MGKQLSPRMWCVGALSLFCSLAARAVTPALVVQNHVAVGAISFSPDGKLLAAVPNSGTEAGVVQLWDLRTGKLLREMSTRGSMGMAVAFTPDGKAVASCCRDGGAELWDVGTGQRRLVLSQTSCSAMSIFPEGNIAALTGESDDSRGFKSYIHLVGLNDGKLVKSFNTTSPLSIAFSPDGRTLVSGGLDHLVRVWDVATGQLRFELNGPDGQVHGIAISADGSLVAVADQETVHLWRLKTGAPVRVDHIKTEGIAFSPGSRLLYLSVNRGEQGVERRLVDGVSGALVASLKGPWLYPNAAVFSPDGETLAVSGGVGARGSGGHIELWNPRTGQLLRDLHSDVTEVRHVAFAPNGTVLAVEGRNGVRLWDLKTLRSVPLRNLEPTDCDSDDGLAFIPDGGSLLAGLRCGRLDLLSLRGVTSRVFTPPTPAFIGNLAISSSGAVALASTPFCMGKDTCEKGAVAWDLASGRVKWTYPASKYGDPAIAFSSDSKQVAIADKQVKLLDADTGALLKSRAVAYPTYAYLVPEPRALAYAKDGRLAVGFDYGNVVEFAGFEDDVGRHLAGKSPRNADSGGALEDVSVLRYSIDGTLLVAGRWDGMLVLFGGAPPRELRGHAGRVTSIDFSTDGRIFATAGEDNAVRIWQASTGSLLATLVQVLGNEYVIATPSGAYMASPGAFAGVAFRLEERAYPFEQFDLQLNRPDAVLASLGTSSPQVLAAYHRAWQGRLRRMGIDEQSVTPDFHVPTVNLLTKNLGISTRKKVLTLRVRAEDGLVPLDHLRVIVNDVPLGGAAGQRLERRTGSVEAPVRIELSAGVNRVRISAVNVHSAESLAETFEITKEASKLTADTYVLAIGVSKYRNAAYDLHYAAKDAADIAALFETSGGARTVKVMRLLDEDATLERIAGAKAFLAKARVDDTVIVFAAGHGLLDDKFDYYFATTDVDFDAPAQRGLPFQAFEELLDGIASRHKLLLVDTCNSGELDKETVEFGEARAADRGTVRARAVRGVRTVNPGSEADGSRQVLGELFADLRRGSGAAIISSASGAEFAFESDTWKNGVFTYTVLNGVRTGAADANHDGRITVSELRDYVISNVQRLTGGAQRPTSRRESLAFDFEISQEDFALRQFKELTWDSPGMCVGATNMVWCACLVRESRKYFSEPSAWITAIHQTAYASQHGQFQSSSALKSILAINRECPKPETVEK
jgi:WD40 repeat protein/uncharacterized caspase-like protein